MSCNCKFCPVHVVKHYLKIVYDRCKAIVNAARGK